VSGFFAEPRVAAEHRPDGSLVLRAHAALGAHQGTLGDMFARAVEIAPDRIFLAERDGPSWRKMTYGEAWNRARGIAASLVAHGLDADRPLLVVADNGIDHALMMLGAMLAGVPMVPASSAYARADGPSPKLKAIAEQIRPGIIFVDTPVRFPAATAIARTFDARLVIGRGLAHEPGVLSIGELEATPWDARAMAAAEAVGPASVAKILFTSGSTGAPKGVVNTHRMLVANQEMLHAVWPGLSRRPPVLLDWLPWSHTFGGNHNFNLVLRHAGTLHIDDGRPLPGAIGRTLENLRDVAPTAYFNVPRGYGMLAEALEHDAELARRFFADLDLLFYSGAALPQSLWDRIVRLARASRGDAVPLVTSWGMTETAPLVTAVHYRLDRAGNVGVPAPGVELKLAPVADKLEMRVRGPNVTPGYWRRPDLDGEVFDEEGFYRTGDAGRLADPERPEAGLVFDGRLAENFKLSSGTWVNVGALRVAAIASLAPLVDDVVVAGHDRDEIAIIAFANAASCRTLAADLPAEAPLAEIVAHPSVRAALSAGLARHNAGADGGATRIGAALLTAEPPSADANEITDKGYINQRAVLAARAHLVERLYASPADPSVVR
jgi:feruloyl-CoA synthase